MALRSKNFSNIVTQADWQKFFLDELETTSEEARQYADEFHASKLTGKNIGTGLAKPEFLNHVSIPYGLALELEAIFTVKVKPEPQPSQNKSSRLDKVPRPTIGMNISQLAFDQFRFEWAKYKQHYQLSSQDVSTSLFFCCDDEVRRQIRILQTPDEDASSWTEQKLFDIIQGIVLSKMSPIVHVKQFLEIKQESNESSSTGYKQKHHVANFNANHAMPTTLRIEYVKNLSLVSKISSFKGLF